MRGRFSGGNVSMKPSGGIDGEGSSDTVMEHIRKIRAKLGAHTLRNYIETVWGCGYKWNG